MREIQASEAKTRLPQLLDEVERGETLIITRDGKPIARLVPEEQSQQKIFDEVKAALTELRKHTGRATVEEILAWRHEGHQY